MVKASHHGQWSIFNQTSFLTKSPKLDVYRFHITLLPMINFYFSEVSQWFEARIKTMRQASLLSLWLMIHTQLPSKISIRDFRWMIVSTSTNLFICKTRQIALKYWCPVDKPFMLSISKILKSHLCVVMSDSDTLN